jgi:hypothetical protein
VGWGALRRAARIGRLGFRGGFELGGVGWDLDGRGGAELVERCLFLLMGRSFRDSLKVLEADIQHANSL